MTNINARHSLVLVTALVGVLALTLLPADAASPSPDIVRQYQSDSKATRVYSDGTIEFDHTLSFAEAADRLGEEIVNYRIDEVEGTPTIRGGCRFRSENDSRDAPDDHPNFVYLERQIGAQEDTCAVTVESAWMSGDVATRLTKTSEEALTISQDSTNEADAAASYRYDGSIQGFVEDPFGIHVAKSTARIQWNGADCPTTWRKSSVWTIFVFTGWEIADRWSRPSSEPCWEHHRTFGLYRNDDFCPGLENTTWVRANVSFIAKRSGNSWRTIDVEFWGGCSELLSKDYVYDRN